jgi:hypothetical protein
MNAILIGALFGATGALLGLGIARLFRLQGRSAQVASVLCTAVFVVLSRPVADAARAQRDRGPMTEAQIDAEFTAVPLLRTIKTYYPDDYRRMAETLKAKLDSGAGRLEAMNAVRPMVTQLIDKKTMLANDANTLALLGIAREEALAAQAKTIDTCFQFATGVTYDFVPSEVFPRELLVREQATSEAMLKQVATAPTSAPSDQKRVEADFVATMTGAARGMSESDFNAVRKLSDPAALKAMTANEKDINCRFTLRMYDELLKLPPDRRAAAYKYLRSQ